MRKISPPFSHHLLHCLCSVNPRVICTASRYLLADKTSVARGGGEIEEKKKRKKSVHKKIPLIRSSRLETYIRMSCFIIKTSLRPRRCPFKKNKFEKKIYFEKKNLEKNLNLLVYVNPRL